MTALPPLGDGGTDGNSLDGAAPTDLAGTHGFSDGPAGPVPHFVMGGSIAVGAFPIAIAAGDLDGDGKNDLAVANWNADTVSILLGRGDGTFRAAPLLSLPPTTHPGSIAIGLVDGDAKPDLAFTGFGTGTGDSVVGVFLGRGDGTFGAAARFAAGDGASAIVIGDLDGDGHADLAAVASNTTSVSALAGLGDGTFKPALAIGLGGKQAQVMAGGDFDGDGKWDVMAVSPSGTAIVLVGCPQLLRFASATLTFAPTSPSSTSWPT